MTNCYAFEIYEIMSSQLLFTFQFMEKNILIDRENNDLYWDYCKTIGESNQARCYVYVMQVRALDGLLDEGGNKNKLVMITFLLEEVWNVGMFIFGNQ